MLICKFCLKECKNPNSHRNHVRLCKNNPDGTRTWLEENRDAFKTINQFIKNPGKKMSAESIQKLRDLNLGKRHTDDTKRKLAVIASSNNLGGHTSKMRLFFAKKDGSVVYLQSSYEVKFALLLEKYDIEWSRPEPLRYVDDRGIDRRYYPDFKVGQVFIDTKNDYLLIKDATKIESVRKQNDIDLRIVTYDLITDDYVLSL